MAYKIKGNVNVRNNLTVQNKIVGTGIKLESESEIFHADIDGHVELPIATGIDIDNVLKQLPLSQYGALNNLPVGASGSYEGGSTVAYYSSMPILLEEDGTLVFLRPGTNGNKINYYYTYINNPDMNTSPYPTIRPYYEGSSNDILFYDSYTKDTLLYHDLQNNILSVVLTYGTLDKTNHKSASFPSSAIPYNILTALKVDSYVYIIALYTSTYGGPLVINPNNNDPLQFVFYRIPTSQIESGAITTIEQISGITGNTLYGSATPGNVIRISDVYTATTQSGINSFIKYNNTIANCAGYTYSLVGRGKAYYDGTNIIFSFYTNAFAANNTQRVDTLYNITITYNVITRNFTTDLTSNRPIYANGASTGIITWDNPYSITSANTYGVGTKVADGNGNSMFVTDNGIQYSIKEKYVLDDTYLVSRCSISNFTNKANAYKMRNRTISLQDYTNVYSEFASRVGDQLTAGSPISTTRILFSGTGTYNGNQYTKYDRGIADIGTSRNYVYNSVERGTITGYAPQIYRMPFGDNNENLAISKLSYHDNANMVESYGTVFFESTQLTTGNKFDPTTLSYDKTLTIDNSILTSLKNTIISGSGLTGITNSKISLYYSPRTDYCKSIACVTAYNSSGVGAILSATVDCTANSTNVLSATMNTIFMNEPKTNMINILIQNEMRQHSGLSCVKYADFTYISFSYTVPYSIPGSSQIHTVCGIVNGNTISNVIVSDSTFIIGFNSNAQREYSYIPNLGFGYYLFSPTDKGTKLIFKNCGNTLSQFTSNMAAGTGTDIVILSQDVTVGFYIYLTERTPVFLNGVYYELPITVLNLNDVKANPGNSTFYIYVQELNGTISYHVSETELGETSTNMYIGTATTDGTNVTTLNINKVSRFDIFRPSETQIGSAFPVSTGYPQQPGSISW
jgi:hypothetical protein